MGSRSYFQAANRRTRFECTKWRSVAWRGLSRSPRKALARYSRLFFRLMANGLRRRQRPVSGSFIQPRAKVRRLRFAEWLRTKEYWELAAMTARFMWQI